MKYLNVPMDYKAAGDTGHFDGYAAVFGNIDLGGDVIKRGAFKKIHKNDDGKVVVLWQHGMRDPIGVATVEQDDKGLHFEGDLVMEDPTARKAYAHMKAKSVRGMSIGFDVMDGGAKVLNSGTRELTALELWEISPVTFGMNPAAGIDNVKGAADITSIREFEEFLRDAGFPRAAAKALAAGGWARLDGQRDVDVSAEVEACLATLRRYAPSAT
jgi:HK97 family phage prohead protease